MYDCISNHQFSIDLYILKDYCYESFEIFELNRICKAIILKAEVDLHSELRLTNSIENGLRRNFREWKKGSKSWMIHRFSCIISSIGPIPMKFVDTHCSDLRIMKFDCSLFQSWMIIMQSSKYKAFKRLINQRINVFFLPLCGCR